MSGRGQLVLLAAVLVAVALSPVVLAYLQLGYHGDVRATTDYGDGTSDVRRVLERAVATASADVTGEYSWVNRDAAIRVLRTKVQPRIATLQTSSTTAGTIHAVSYNGTAARAWESDNCRRGPDRQFGQCYADRGVVVQDRLGRSHVLAVGFDLTTTTSRGETRITVIAGAVGR